jgi:hypothetical protein
MHVHVTVTLLVSCIPCFIFCKVHIVHVVLFTSTIDSLEEKIVDESITQVHTSLRKTARLLLHPQPRAFT